MTVSRVSAILLAAGASRRMGGRDKLMLEYAGKTLLMWAVELLDSLTFHEKILVTTKKRLGFLELPTGVRAIANPEPANGQSGSIRLGLEAASGDWYLFLVSDQPLLTTECLLQMLRFAGEYQDKIIFPTVFGKPCSPSLFPARFRGRLLSLAGDAGGREVRDAYPDDCMTFDAVKPEAYIDIDSEESYSMLLKNSEQDWNAL